MLKNNALLAQLKSNLVQQKHRVQGVVQGSRKSFGFLLDEQGLRHFIAPPEMRKVLPGDEVIAVIETENDRTQAVVEEVLSSDVGELYGIVRKRKGQFWLEPESPFMSGWMMLDSGQSYEDGLWVKAVLIEHPFKNGKARAKVLEQLAHEDDNDLPWKLAMSRQSIHQDPEGAAVEPCATDIYADLSAIPFVTIDSESTLDVDDAIHAERVGDGYILTVAIADPSSVVAEGSDLDKQALLRSNTTYLPGESYSMLPRELSEGGCSLLEGTARRSLACRMHVGHNGEISDIRFTMAVITSRAKLSYAGVDQYLNGEHNLNRSDDIREVVRALFGCSEILRQWRQDHAVLVNYGDDLRFMVQNHELTAIVRQPRNLAHFLVEECMVAANRAFATYCNSKDLPCVYRTHGGFAEKHLEKAKEMLAHWGLVKPDENVANFDVFLRVCRELEKAENFIPRVLARGFYDKACYSYQANAHRGLGLDLYATFTSPIRKYSDLINHRLMKAHLLGKVASVPDEAVLQHLDERAAASNQASREVQRHLFARHFKANEVYIFEGVVVGVTSGGLRVEEKKVGASVFAPLRNLTSRDQQVEILAFGSELWVDGKLRYRIGDEVRFGISEIEPVLKGIDVKLMDPVKPESKPAMDGCEP